MRPEEEIKNSFRISVGDNDIIILEFLQAQEDPDDNVKQADFIIKNLENTLSQNPEKIYSLLIDLMGTHISTDLPGRSKELYAKAMVFKKMRRIAVVTPSLMMKLITSAVSLRGGKFEGIKSFNTRIEALKWLKQG